MLRLASREGQSLGAGECAGANGGEIAWRPRARMRRCGGFPPLPGVAQTRRTMVCVQGDLQDMRALRLSLRHSSWLRTFVGALIVLSLVFAGPAFAQDAIDDDEDDFLSDDFGGDEEEDDFLSDDFAEETEEAYVQEKGAYYWAFEVPLDVVLLRPVGAMDVTVGGMFVGLVAIPMVAGATGEAVWDWLWGEGWYFDTTNLDAAFEQAVTHPAEFLFDRPLGQLVSY
jgi:hypothetical protein